MQFTKRIAIFSLLAALLLASGCANGVVVPGSGSQESEAVPTQDVSTEESSETGETTAGVASVGSAFSQGDIEFLATPQKLEGFIAAETLRKIRAIYLTKFYPDQPAEWADYFVIDVYKTGVIQQEPYKGWDLVLFSTREDGMMGGSSFFLYAAQSANETVLLSKHSARNANIVATMQPAFTRMDDAAVLPSMVLPEEIEVPGTHKYISLLKTAGVPVASLTFLSTYRASQDPALRPILDDPQYGTLYAQQEADFGHGVLRMEHPAGISYNYYYNPRFYGDIDDAPEDSTEFIRWNDGTLTSSLTDFYLPTSGSCGFSQGYYRVISSVDEQNLEPVGTTVNGGIELFAIRNVYGSGGEVKELNQAFKSFQMLNQYAAETGGTPSADADATLFEFAAKNPVLLWKDPFGRWSGLVSNEAKTMAECGKPVIYLYPQEPTDVHVQVHIDEFTVTDPPYGDNGWTVHAKPNGELYNYADGKTYPYLFWEGKKQSDLMPLSGFVVARGELEKFLQDSLEEAGLNEVERRDFVEFWYPRMMASSEPYFFISFVGTREFNEVAPLSITPAPDTLLRVFMYYEPVTSWFAVPPQNLRGPQRRGFTVVEWGGTSPAPWQIYQ